MISASQGLALVRIGVGLYFLVQAWDKTMGGWLTDGAGLARQLERSVPRAEAFYRPFLESVVLANPALFAQLVTLGEWVAGISLTLGLLTRTGALVGLFLALNYLLMKGVLSGFANVDRLFVLCCLAFALARTGLAWGLDGALTRALGRSSASRWLRPLSG